jgi:acetyltransferase
MTATLPPRVAAPQARSGSRRNGLDVFFAPETVAVIGASDTLGSVGRTLLSNLVRHPFGGTIFPIDPQHTSVLGIQTYPTIADVLEPIDLAIVASPAPTVPAIICQCADTGVRGTIVLSAGFKETSPAGLELERQVLEAARRGSIRLLGPNCLGLMRPPSGLNATCASAMVQPGQVALLSQSGALGTAILDWSLGDHVGFSAFVSVGSMLDVGWGDLIDYLGDDPQTQSIVIYMESIGDARSFLSAARAVARSKPIIVLKAGRTNAAANTSAAGWDPSCLIGCCRSPVQSRSSAWLGRSCPITPACYGSAGGYTLNGSVLVDLELLWSTHDHQAYTSSAC